MWRILYQESRENSTEKEKINLDQAFYVPFHPRGKRVVKILNDQFGIPTIFKKTKSLGDILLKKSRQITKEFKKNSIYKIPRAECPKKYVGQTSATLKKRTNEHIRWCQKKNKQKILKSSKKNDGIAFHHHQIGQTIDFENTEIITQEKNYWRRLIVEGKEI